jgi:4-amino-4-deoxy-L-arabinose transferase-like glycosyltransferase
MWSAAVRRWLDGIERGWSIPLFLTLFVAVWVVALALAYSNAGLHPDVLETWSLGRDPAWGSSKHPPLMGWVAWAWTLVFPLTDWSFQLLAMVNAAIALWIVDLIVRRFVSGDKRAMVLLLLLLLPAYQFHAQRFNANSVLLAVWPLTIYCFLRSYETRSLGWAVASGATAALAMLGKYYSVFLIASLCLAAIMHPQRRQYLRSAAPWISAITGLVVLFPHLYWLYTSNFPTFAYAMQTHGGLGPSAGVNKAFLFLGGVLAWLIVPAVVWMALTRSRIGLVIDDLKRIDDRLLLLLLVLLGTLVLPALAAVVLRTSMPALWSLQGLFLAVVILVCASQVTVVRQAAVGLTTAVCLLSLAAVVTAPLHARYRNDHPFKEGRSYYTAATKELVRRWRAETRAPLVAISGNENLALATAFYAEDHPSYRKMFAFTGASSAPDWAYTDGWAALCFANDPHCVAWIRKVATLDRKSSVVEFDVTSSFWGRAGTTARICAIMMLPDGKTQDDPDGDDDDMIEYSSQSRSQPPPAED